MSLEWKDCYLTGDAGIDAQHKGLFDGVGKLLASLDHEDRLFCLMGLVRDAQSHFDYEEKVMRRVGYPKLAAHFREHTDLMARITEFSERVAKSCVSSIEVEEFVLNWLLVHIQSSDASLATYIWSYYPNWTDADAV